MNENNEPKTSFFKRWNAAGLRSHPKIATIVLAVILVLCLACAQIQVFFKSGSAKDREKARENAQALIQEVSRAGLDSFAGRKPILRYYLLESQGHVSGYAILTLSPKIQKDNTLVYDGKYLHYSQHEHQFITISYTTANDLSFSSYTKSIYTSQSKWTRRLEYREGFLYEPTLQGTSDRRPVKGNFVPPDWLDFLSALSAGKEGFRKEGVLLAVLDFNEKGQAGVIECLVKAGGEIPPEILATHPHGDPVEVLWQGGEFTQTIYYDSEHQLVWQKDTHPSLEMRIRSVTRDQLEKAFPDARGILDQRLRVNEDEDQI